MTLELVASVGLRKLDGAAVSLAKTPEGGAEAVAWTGDAWEPSSDSVEEVLTSPPAGESFLRSVGLSAPSA